MTFIQRRWGDVETSLYRRHLPAGLAIIISHRWLSAVKHLPYCTSPRVSLYLMVLLDNWFLDFFLKIQMRPHWLKLASLALKTLTPQFFFYSCVCLWLSRGIHFRIYSQISVARTSLGPWKFVPDMGSSNRWGLIITPGHDANGDNLEIALL